MRRGAFAFVALVATAVEAASLAPNTVEITPQLVTAGQPSRDSLARLREQGFGAVIHIAPPTVHDAVQDEPVIADVSRVWVPNPVSKRYIRDMLQKRGIAFEPY